MQESIFTKIISGSIPSHKIYEDDHVYAFLDIHPVAPGHTLVVPKAQIEYVWDIPDDQYAHLMLVTKQIALHLRETLGTDFIGEKVVGIDVPHAHIHLIPFTKISEFRNRPDESAEPDHMALAALADKLAF